MVRRITQYFTSSIAELRQVTWPTRADVIRHSAIILVSIFIAMAVIAVVDYGLNIIANKYLIG